MKTFWLYFENTLLTSVRMPATATKEQIIEQALKEYWIAPCINALYPSLNPGEIANRIRLTTRISS